VNVKRVLGHLRIFGSIALLGEIGCSKPTVKEQVSELERAFPGARVENAVPGEQAVIAQTPLEDANSYVSRALVAVRTNDYRQGVIALQNVAKVRGISPQQLMAVESAKQALTAELVARADRGDAQAKADLAAIERTRSQ